MDEDGQNQQEVDEQVRREQLARRRRMHTTRVLIDAGVRCMKIGNQVVVGV